MALVKATLKGMIQAAVTASKAESDVVQAEKKFVDELATAIDTYIKSATVVGACATPSGPGTITGTLQ